MKKNRQHSWSHIKLLFLEFCCRLVSVQKTAEHESMNECVFLSQVKQVERHQTTAHENSEKKEQYSKNDHH